MRPQPAYFLFLFTSFVTVGIASTILWAADCPVLKYESLPFGKTKVEVLSLFPQAQCKIVEWGDSQLEGLTTVEMAGQLERLGLEEYNKKLLPLVTVSCSCWKQVSELDLLFTKESGQTLIAVEKRLNDLHERTPKVMEILSSQIGETLGQPPGRPFSFQMGGWTFGGIKTETFSYLANRWIDRKRKIETYIVVNRNPFGDWASWVSIGHLWRPYFEEEIRKKGNRQQENLNLRKEF